MISAIQRGIQRRIQRGMRWIVAGAAVLVVVWAFGVVISRAVRHAFDATGRTTIALLHWATPEENAIADQVCGRYMAAHPDVEIKRISVGGSVDMISKLKTMMAAGTPPDLFFLPPAIMPELASLKLIRPIDDFVAADVAAGRGAYVNDFYPILLDAYHYDVAKAQTGVGRLYALPKDFTTAVFYVNLDLFHEAGVPVPYDGWTWDEFESDMAKITALGQRPEFADRKIYGGNLQIWPDSLVDILWTFGGDYFGKNFRDVTLDSPASQEALQAIARMRLKEKTLYNATGIAKDAGEEFAIGDIGCCGPLGRWMVPKMAEITKFKWDVVPTPQKDRAHPVALMFTNGWGMSSAAKDPARCFDLMKYMCGSEGAALQSRLGQAIPPLRSVATSSDFLSPPGLPQMNAQEFLKEIPFIRVQNNPPQAEWARLIQDRITRSLQLGQVSTLENAHEIRDAWLAELDSPLRRRQWQPMRWNVVITATSAALAAVLGVVFWKSRQQKLGPLDRAQERSGWMFIAPWVIGFVALTLGPMIVSLLLSFTQWTGMTPMSDARSVGVANYTQLLTNDPTFYHSLRVTSYYVLLGVPIGQMAALAVAMLVNTPVRGVTIFRTIFFVPSVVSGVALAVLWRQIFNNDYGVMNQILRPITHLFHMQPPDWFGTDAGIFAIPAFVIMGLWGVGSGMILYLAGLKGIPGSLYEAARIDGAGPARRFWNITLPMLSPLLFYNLVMGIITSFQMFTQAHEMPGPNDSTLVYVVNLYKQAFEFHNMGLASALAWVLFVLVLLLTIAVFRGSRGLVYYEGLKA